MDQKIPLTDLIFLDIETVPVTYRFEDLPEKFRKLFEKKVKYRLDDENTVEKLYEQAGIWSEFGKVVSIAFGKFTFKEGKRKFHLHALAGDNEKNILENTAKILDKFSRQSHSGTLCAHNGKEFDFPYLARRMIINRIPLPDILKVHGKKPWETAFCDTLELWKFGDRKKYTSLELLAEILEIPGAKTDMDGSDVARVYYEEKDLEKIKKYCSSDVITLTNVYLRLTEQPVLKDDEIVIQT
jgi:predicted PolB exonuclease-like 3'-5' exonuclease